MRKQTPVFLIIIAAAGLIGLCRPLSADETITAAVPAAVYFPVLPIGALPDASPQLIPVASNHPLMGDHKGFTRALIAIHDFSRDSSHVLSEMTVLAGPANDSTLIVAPQFLLESDIARFAEHLPEGGRNFARWPLGGWNFGGDSLAPSSQQKGISSFTVVDLLVAYLADKGSFPDLQQIVIAGHGDGGDFVQRYAAAGQAPDMLDQQNMPPRFVAANASSYLYFTPVRSVGGKQVADASGASSCPDFDSWPYGLEALNPYARHVGENAIKLRYVTRSVTYLIGGGPTPSDPSPDTSCAAQLQGTGRASRAANYAAYLNTAFGEAAAKMQHFVVVPTTGYDSIALFGSPCGMSVLFGDGNCAANPAP